MKDDLGLDWYATDPPGTGGELKHRPEDFRVNEISDYSYGDTGRYAVLRVTLKGYETHEFARDLSNRLGISRKRVRWAGTKDSYAVTTQLYTVDTADDVTPDDLGGLSLSDADIDVVGCANHPISLGDLRGNEFTVRVRAPPRPGEAERITGELEEFGGAPNLFGGQRFGSRRPITHTVGYHILREDYEAAVDTYIAETTDAEPSETREARERYQSEGDPAEALDYYPRRLSFERALLNALVEGERPRMALENLSHNLRRMFVNAVQSQLFNVVLRERHEAGLAFDRAYEGDVVCFATDGAPDVDRSQRVTESNRDSVNRHVEAGRAYVTAPLIGSDTEFSDGRMGEIERRVAEEHGVSRELFDRDDEYGSEGTRRAITVDPDIDVRDVEGDLEFTFQLPKGSYATVVLREFLKDDAGG